MTSDKEKRITGFRKMTPLGLKYLDLMEEVLTLRFTRHYLGWGLNRFENEVEQKARHDERMEICLEALKYEQDVRFLRWLQAPLELKTKTSGAKSLVSEEMEMKS